MANSNTILYSQFDTSKISFGPVEKTKMGGKIIELRYDGSKRLSLQTPTVALPFGLNKPFTDGDNQSFSVDLSFRGYDTSPAIADFMAKMREFDAVVLKAAVENSPEWFGKAKSEEVISEFFRPNVRESKNPQYAPTFKVKIPNYNGIPSARFFDENKEPAEMAILAKGTRAKFLLEVTSVWFVNNNFGVSWRMRQALVVSRPDNMNSLAFMDDDADEDAAAAPAAAAFLDD